MTYEEKSEIVIRQLREDRDRLQNAIDGIRAEIDVARFIDKDTKLCKNANASGLEVALQIIDKYRGESDCHECKTEYDCYECKKYAESEEKHDTDR